MRNLEDCKAEVFRRSEERIKERKRKRNRVLACCIPLCLLLVAGGMYIRPLLEPVDESMKWGDTSKISDWKLGGLDGTSFGCVAKYSSVMITEGTGSAAVSGTVTVEENVEELCGFMAMYFDMSGTTVKEEMADGTDGTSTGNPLFGIADGDTIRDELKDKYGLEEPPADYTLVFRKATGEEAVFRLHENHLYNEENGCVVKLSDAMTEDLRKIIDNALGAESDK